MSVWTDWVVPSVCVLAMVVALSASVSARRARDGAWNAAAKAMAVAVKRLREGRRS